MISQSQNAGTALRGPLGKKFVVACFCRGGYTRTDPGVLGKSSSALRRSGRRLTCGRGDCETSLRSPARRACSPLPQISLRTSVSYYLPTPVGNFDLLKGFLPPIFRLLIRRRPAPYWSCSRPPWPCRSRPRRRCGACPAEISGGRRQILPLHQESPPHTHSPRPPCGFSTQREKNSGILMQRGYAPP